MKSHFMPYTAEKYKAITSRSCTHEPIESRANNCSGIYHETSFHARMK